MWVEVNFTDFSTFGEREIENDPAKQCNNTHQQGKIKAMPNCQMCAFKLRQLGTGTSRAIDNMLDQ